MLQKIDRKEMFTIPNILSFARIILAVLFFAVYQAEHGKNVIALGTILMISGVTDMLDGKIARKFNQISEFGKILDPFADKLTQAVILLCLMSKYKMVKYVILVFIIKEICMVSRGFKLVKKTKKNEGAKWYGKFSTAVFYIVMGAIILLPDIPVKIANSMILISGMCMVLAFAKYMEYYNVENKKGSLETTQVNE